VSVIEANASIRRARLEDAEAIAAVHVAAWRESYTGLVPAEMLANLSVEDRAKRWRRILGEPNPEIRTVAFVSCAPDGAVVGFGSCGLQRSAELAGAGFSGEFQAIYVLRAAQHRGVGRTLMNAMAHSLQEDGVQGGALWVLEGNQPARGFYDVLGGMVIAHREDKRGESTVFVEVAYGWTNLTSVAKACVFR